MKPRLRYIFFLISWACSSSGLKIAEHGEVRFRTSYNSYTELTNAELDSLQKCKPEYYEGGKKDQIFDLLIRKRVISDNKLDTSGLMLTNLSTESPIVQLSNFEFKLESNNEIGRQFLRVIREKEKFKIDLGESLLGDRWIALLDIDNNGSLEILMLEKYYIMGGDNFDLKIYSIE